MRNLEPEIKTLRSDGEADIDDQSESTDEEFVAMRPLVEWIYPNRFRGQNSNRQNDNTEEAEENPSGAQSVSEDIVIDPSLTVTIPTIDGVVVQEKRCFLRIHNLVLFDDTFCCFINPKCLVSLVVIITIATLAIIVPFSQTDNEIFEAGPSMSVLPTISPSNLPTDMRTINITEILFAVSDAALFQVDTPQSKALKWILEEDKMNLTYRSPNLVQRYALMVLFFGLSGEQWRDKSGFGSDKHECDWSAIICGDINKRLSFLDLSNNNAFGELPRELGVLSTLLSIFLHSNFRISGTIPTEIGMLKRLTILKFDENRLTGTIPNEITNCTNLNEIHFHSNRLSGSLPTGLENIRRLTEFRVSSNQLTGTIPMSIMRLPVISELRLEDNKFVGTIPSEIGTLKFLENLYLDNNNLEGHIPSTMGELNFLKDLRLHRNRINGTIPVELGQAINLDTLDLSNNQITGTIPISLSKLTRLDVLRLHGNNLNGIVHEGICELVISDLTADCKSNNISCSCCSECF